ncbi:MAG: cupin domain-containing protein [Candidatus Binatia bacterium]
MSADPKEFDGWYVTSSYEEFVKMEGVPLYEGSYLEDLSTLPLSDWERGGGNAKAAYTRLGNQETNGLQIVEIPPKGELKAEHHMYDEVMFVLKGRGATTLWQEGEPKHTVEWDEGALLALPLNAWHQEFNASSDEPCRLLFGSNLPQVLNLYHNRDFIFNNPYVFRDRYSNNLQNFFSDKGRRRKAKVYETNFITDVRKFELDPLPEGGYRTEVMRISMASTILGIHIKSIAEGTYTNAHRHPGGAHVMVITGEGYELLFMPGEEKKRQKVLTKPYSVIGPKDNEFHHHFNTGKGPYVQLAFRGGPARYGLGRRNQHKQETSFQDEDPHSYSFKISYEKEDPSIREEYYGELEKRGITLRLPPIDQD